MKEINQYIKKETREFKRKSIYFPLGLDNIMVFKKLKDDYNLWLFDLNQLIKNGLCRQALKEIEEKKYKFELIKKELWKYRIIKAKAILKIIRLKMNRHSKEIILENSSQNLSLKFWFNQIFLTLEELILEFRYDINKHIDYNSKKIIEPIQIIIGYHLEIIYYLCIFSIKTNDIIALIKYLSIVERFIEYIPFISKSSILNIFQNIILLKAKLLIENNNFVSALETIKIVFKLCFREMNLFLSVDSEININSLYNINKQKKKENKTIFGFCRIIKKLIMGYFLRGVICEHLGYLNDSIHSYKECRWFSNTFLFDYSKEIFKIFRNLEKKYLIYKEIFDDIHNQFLIKDENKKNQNSKKKLIQRKKYVVRAYNNNSYKGSYKSIDTNKSKNGRIINIKSSAINSSLKKEKLEKLLKIIGINLYKEEENRNNNIFKKYTKNNFVLSTVKMINNLLSDQFSHVLKKMEKIEITKSQEEINHLINWAIYFQKQNEFEKNKKKINTRNKSCLDSKYLNNNSYFNTKEKTLSIKIRKNIEINDNKIQNNYRKLSQSQVIDNKISKLDNIFKFKYNFSASKANQNKSNKSFLKKTHKILKYPLNKDVFSTSLLNKKTFLDSFYEKEINFQKKLLKLKGYDMEKVYNEYNQQKAINSAEQDFQIIRCFAESKNTKKNLMNLVKNTNEFQGFEALFPDKKLRNRSNKLLDLNQLKNYMLINNISTTKVRYEPKKVKQYNEEKSKALSVECAKLEQLENKYKIKRKILMSEGIRKK